MLKKLLGCRCSSARLCDNKLVLSLENAITPVMWVINLDETPSLLLKVETTDDGLFVLQKLTQGEKGRIAEDLAFYRKKGYAIDAMERASSAMKNKIEQKPSSKFIRYTVNIIAFTSLLLAVSYFTRLDVKIVRFLADITAPDTVTTNAPSEVENTVITPRDEVSSNPNDVGVPLSADDYFNEQKNTGSGLFY